MSRLIMKPFVSASSAKVARKASTCCSAIPDSQRRAIIGGLIMFPTVIPASYALIIDEEDEELVEKAKANRKNRIVQQRETTRTFLKDEGIASRKVDSEIAPLQKGVYKLAQVGSQLESGDAKAASSSLSESWVVDFEKTSAQISSDEAAQLISRSISVLKDAASKGDLVASKKAYVSVVASVQDFVTKTGLSSTLKGI